MPAHMAVEEPDMSGDGVPTNQLKIHKLLISD